MTDPLDTPTHRVHLLQAKMEQIVEWTKLLQTQRAEIVEKVVRAKANNKVARELTVNRSLDRTLARILRNLSKSEELLNKAADDLNKCRGLFLELSDGDVLLQRTELVHGNGQGAGDRGDVPTSTDRPASNTSPVHVGGEAASPASADLRDRDELRQDAGPDDGPHREDGHS